MGVLAVDVGGSSVKIAVVLGDGSIVRSTQVPHHGSADGFGRAVDVVADWQREPADGPVDAIGLALPGLLDEAGTMVSAPDKLHFLVGRPLVDEWQQRFGVRVVVENDARAAALGEFRFGAGAGSRVLAVLTLGTGIGCGIVVAGGALRNEPGHGGVLGGHQMVDPEGPPCTCGRQGCWEAHASGWALPRVIAAQRRARPHDHSPLTEDSPFALVAESAAAGDPVSGAVLDHHLHWWAVGMVNLHSVLGCDRIVLTGGLAAALPPYLDRLTTAVRDQLWSGDVCPTVRLAPDVFASVTRGLAAATQDWMTDRKDR